MKKAKKSKSSKFNRSSFSTRQWLFALVFAVIGTALIVRSFARPNYPTDSDVIVAGYVNEKATTLSQKQEGGAITYEMYAVASLVMGDGSLQCDTGDRAGTVYTGKLSKGEMKKLHSDIQALDVDTLEPEHGSGDSLAAINNFEGYVFADKGTSHAFAVHPGGQKPDKLAKMQEKIAEACAKAITKGNRSNVKPVKLPKQEAHNDKDGILKRIALWVSPKASAYPSNAYATPDYDLADDQAKRIIAARGGKIKRLGCINDVAYGWSLYQATAGKYFHNPNLVKDFQNKCKRYDWRKLGENVGVSAASTSLAASEGLWKAFLDSASHKANIYDTAYNYFGTGAYRRTDNGYRYITQNFVKLP